MTKKKLGCPANDPGVPWRGAALRVLRSAYGFSQSFIADEIGVSGSNVSDWENGNMRPAAEDVEALAYFFDVPQAAFASVYEAAAALVGQGEDLWG